MARVLLGDDDPDTLDVLEVPLTLDGHQTTRAGNGHDGLEWTVAEYPDLVTPDSVMRVGIPTSTSRSTANVRPRRCTGSNITGHVDLQKVY